MEDFFLRIWNDLIARIDGPMKFRIILQPLISLYFAVKAGRRDAKSGKVPYFVGLITGKGSRKELVKQGWKDVGKVFLVAIIIDVIYQCIMIFSRGTQPAFYLLETLITAFILAFIPYLIFRGITNRIFSKNEKE
jgi:hypothetical protein